MTDEELIAQATAMADAYDRQPGAPAFRSASLYRDLSARLAAVTAERDALVMGLDDMHVTALDIKHQRDALRSQVAALDAEAQDYYAKWVGGKSSAGWPKTRPSALSPTTGAPE